MTLTDWRGNPCTFGTLIVRPRGSGGSIAFPACRVLVASVQEATADAS
jgi:hypothetical protein